MESKLRRSERIRQLTHKQNESLTSQSVRTIGRKRASSVGPESIQESKGKETSELEHTGTLVRTRRRALIAPAHSPVSEETEEKQSIPYVQLENILPKGEESYALELSDSSANTTSQHEHTETSDSILKNDSIQFNSSLTKSEEYRAVEELADDTQVNTAVPNSSNADETECTESESFDLSIVKEEDRSPENKENQCTNTIVPVPYQPDKEIATTNATMLSPKHFDSGLINIERKVKTVVNVANQVNHQSLTLDALRKVLKRLPEEDLEKLLDVPLRPKKKQKLSQNRQDGKCQYEKQVIASGMIKSCTVKKRRREDFKCDNITALSSHGSTTQFSVVSLKKVEKQRKKQPPFRCLDK